MLRRKGWSLAKTSLRSPFMVAPLQWVVSRHQPHECEARAQAAGASRLLNEFQTRPATRFICGRPDSHKQRYSRSIQLLPPSESGSGSTSCMLFNSRSSSSSYLQRRWRTGPAIKQRTSEPDLDGGNISNVNSSLVPLFVTVGPPTDEPRIAGRVRHSVRGATEKDARRNFASDQPFYAKWC